jgi:hypothetical protein
MTGRTLGCSTLLDIILFFCQGAARGSENTVFVGHVFLAVSVRERGERRVEGPICISFHGCL